MSIVANSLFQDRQGERDRRPLADFTFALDLAAMVILNDQLGDDEAEAGAAGFGAEIRIEQPLPCEQSLQLRLGHSAPGVGQLKKRPVSL